MNSVNQIADKLDKFCRDNNVRVVCALDDSDDQITLIRGEFADVQILLNQIVKDVAKAESIRPNNVVALLACRVAHEQAGGNINFARKLLVKEIDNVFAIVNRVQEVAQ